MLCAVTADPCGVASAQPNVIEESVKSRTVGMPGASGTSLAVVNVV